MISPTTSIIVTICTQKQEQQNAKMQNPQDACLDGVLACPSGVGDASFPKVRACARKRYLPSVWLTTMILPEKPVSGVVK